MDKSAIIKINITSSIKLKEDILNDKSILHATVVNANIAVKAYQNGGKILFCGNGGSAADAQHLAAELSGRYYYDRFPLNAEALHVNTSYLTAVANDYYYDKVNSRLVNAVGNKGDLLIGLSTSGFSDNVVNALIQAKKQGCLTVGLTGKGER